MSTSFLARHYNAMTGFPARVDNLTRAIEPWVSDWKVRVALDAGCGGGALMFALDNLGVDVVGLDLNESMLRLALDNARVAGKSFRFAGAPFSSAGTAFPSQFDAAFVLGNALIGHDTESEMIESLLGLNKSLKPGGHILIQNLNPMPFALGVKTLINRRIDGAVRYLRYAVPADPEHLFFSVVADGPGNAMDAHVHLWKIWDRAHLHECLEASGFDQIEVYGGINRSPYDVRSSTDLVFVASKHA